MSDSDDLLESDQLDEGFQDIEVVNDHGVAAEPRNGKNLWLILAIILFLLALLSSLFLSPMISSQLQRASQASAINDSIELTQTLAQQALTESGTYGAIENSAQEMESLVASLSQPNGIAGSFGEVVFGNSQSNNELSESWNKYKATLNTFIATKEPVTEIKQKLTAMRDTVSSAMLKSVDFSEAIATEGRDESTGASKDRYLFLTAVASDLNGILGRINVGVNSYYANDANIAGVSNSQNGLVIQLRDTMSRILEKSSEIVTTAAEPVQAE